MTEHPIIFSGPMVRAILEGRKTQTRRVIKPQPTEWVNDECHYVNPVPCVRNKRFSGLLDCIPCPYGIPGEKLWVRESWAFKDKAGELIVPVYRADGEEVEDGDGSRFIPRWIPSIHMTRKASRIDLEITRVRVERLHDISDEDAKAEGSEALRWGDLHQMPMSLAMSYGGILPGNPKYRFGFYNLWESINAKSCYSWDADPWVWVIEFKRIKP